MGRSVFNPVAPTLTFEQNLFMTNGTPAIKVKGLNRSWFTPFLEINNVLEQKYFAYAIQFSIFNTSVPGVH